MALAGPRGRWVRACSFAIAGMRTAVACAAVAAAGVLSAQGDDGIDGAPRVVDDSGVQEVVTEFPAGLPDVGITGAGSQGVADEATGLELRDTASDGGVATSLSSGEIGMEPMPRPRSRNGNSSFDYHKGLFPLDWRTDGVTILLACIGLMIAASGGIGGGGILVPLYMLQLGFKPKHAIALSNFTILGGAIANTLANCRRRHPELDRQLIDWDLILIMEPLTIFGAVLGSLMSKVLPNAVITSLLVMILALMGRRTMSKALKMWREETRAARITGPPQGGDVELIATAPSAAAPGQQPSACDDNGTTGAYLELQSDGEDAASEPSGGVGRGNGARHMGHLGRAGQHQRAVGFKIAALTACFAGTVFLTVLKGGGSFRSPLGFPCGSAGFWALYFGACPWVFGFAIWFRNMLMSEHHEKVRKGYYFVQGEVQWNAESTIRYPAICAISGLMAGLFGVGGGIIKGPLMLEMGIMPSVASASAAAMILFTSAAASASFVVFGLLHPHYGAIFFVLGFVCTGVGQYGIGYLAKKHGRQSPIVFSIGGVICLSAVFVLINTVHANWGVSLQEVLRAHGVCSSEA